MTHERPTGRIAEGDGPDDRREGPLAMQAIVVAFLMSIPCWGLLAFGIGLLAGIV